MRPHHPRPGPQAYNPSSRNADNYYGGFDVEYDPGAEALDITLKGAVLFLAGITLDGAGNAVAVETSAQTAAAVAAINKLPAANRAAAVNPWQWTSQGGPDADDEQKFLGGAGDAGTITIGDGKKQTVVAHESGHMFGLDDEYTGTGDYAAGKKTEHSDLAAKAGQSGAMHAKSDSIMSEGGKVRAQHYTTFLDALKLVSGMNEWDFGAKQVVKPPSGAGDFNPPAPSNNGTAVA